MNCPHCYLQTNKVSSDWVNKSIVSKILNSNFEHLAIVGKEPLVNLDHIKKLKELSKQVKKLGGTISIVTNGKNLRLIDEYFLKNIDFIDISFDGGKETYSNFRNGDFEQLKNDIQRIYDMGFKNLNVLHSIHSENLENVDDMMSVLEIIPFKRIMFTPYLDTKNFGENKVSKITLKQLFKRLSLSKLFMCSKQAIVNVDLYHLEQAKRTANELLELADEFGLKEKLILHDKDLLPFGVVRVTYGGRVLTPHQSLNTKGYSKGLELKDFDDVNGAWEKLVEFKI